MAVKNMSIHRALAELKTYQDRIKNALHKSFIVSNKKSNEKIEGKQISEYKDTLRGNYDSVNSLIKNYVAIKSAVAASNASTTAVLCGETYTITQIIERKRVIDFQKGLLDELKRQFAYHNRVVNAENDKLPEKIEQYLKSILGEKDKRTVDDIELHTKSYENRHSFELIDPLDIQEKIKLIEEEIRNFETDVDIVLSESNATTYIDVELAD